MNEQTNQRTNAYVNSLISACFQWNYPMNEGEWTLRLISAHGEWDKCNDTLLAGNQKDIAYELI